MPKQYENLYFAWMRDIRDWCISRQQWWGHRIPAWYDANGGIYVARDEAEVRRKYKLAADVALTPDDDVLETWFSSAMWTFGTLGWPEKTRRTRDVPPDRRAGHRPRHHLLLGRPDDHDDVALHRSGAVPQGLHHRPRARCRRPEDVEEPRQRPRPARLRRRHLARRSGGQACRGADAAADGQSDRESHAARLSRWHPVVRHRRVAVRFLRARLHRPRRSIRSEADRGLSKLLQQAVERDQVRVDEHRGRDTGGAVRGNAGGPLDRVATETHARGRRTRNRHVSIRSARETSSTTSPGTSTATGTSN